MKQQDCFKYAYAAGIIDGEGTILIVKEKPGGRRIRPSNYFYAKVAVGMQDREAVDLLFGVFGGCLNKTTQNGKDFFTWYVSSKKALECLKKVRPFLRVKKEQADVAIRLQDHVSNHQTRRTVSINELQLREELYDKIKMLKVKPSAAVETKRDSSSDRGEAIVHS